MSLRADATRAALGTAVSRMFGLAREAVLAHFFGATGSLDAFWIAFLIPNILRRLLGEGGVSIAFVPTYLREEREGREGEFLRAAFTFALVVLSLLCILGSYIAPKFVPLLAAGFPPDRLLLASGLARVLFPFLGFVGIAALFGGLLNIKGYFFLPAISPALFSLGAIVGAALSPGTASPVFALALGVLAGAAGQAALLAVPLRRILRLGKPWHPGLVEVGRRLVPAFAGLLLSEVNALVDNRLASGLAPGSISVLQYGMRLFQLPMGVIAASVGMAILPRLSRASLYGDDASLRRGLAEGVEAVLAWILPAMAGLLVLGKPIVGFLFGHGAFGNVAVAGTYAALAGYLVGIWGYALIHLFTRAFHALGLLRLPPLVVGVSAVVNVILDLVLVGVWGVFGLAVATGLSGCVGGILAGSLLWRRVRGWVPVWGLLRIVAGTGIMAGAVWAFDRWVGAGIPEFARVFGGMAVGILSYAPFLGRKALRALWIGLGRGSP
ncbi:MAG: murein biosynthesis integral membrane protein MurJ [Caldiserica bacterium]|nr:murein biosynthesis integral membrane protein MurJ [Caldisericota bacterium]